MKMISGRKSLPTIEDQEARDGDADQTMFSFLSMKGFLGTGATFGADLNLVVQFIMGAALVAGAALAKKKRYTAHGICQTTVLLLNLIMIALVMLPSFRLQVVPAIPRVFRKRYYTVATIHRTPGHGGATSGTLHHPGGGYEHSSAVATLYALETVDARGTDALVDCPARWHGNVLRVVYRARAVVLSASSSGTFSASADDGNIS